jgi:hypothetical protein
LIAYYRLLEHRWQELVVAEVRDNGKRVTEVNGQFAGLHTLCRYFAKQMLDVKSEQLKNQIPGVSSTAFYLPFGVIGVITPWNSPLIILAWKIAPVLAAANTVVIKPSEHASGSTLEFARLCAESSIPDGVINVITGLGHEAGEPLVKHSLIRKVTRTRPFTLCISRHVTRVWYHRAGGIRCSYHGWKYDMDGTILERPCELVSSKLKEGTCFGAYLVVGYKGLAFAYMGPADTMPAFPMFDTMVEEGNKMIPYLIESPCNWLQVMEKA